MWRRRRSWEYIRKRESLIGWFCYPKEKQNLTQISDIKNHSIPNSLLETESKPKPKCNPIHSNPIQPNTIITHRPKSYLIAWHINGQKNHSDAITNLSNKHKHTNNNNNNNNNNNKQTNK